MIVSSNAMKPPACQDQLDDSHGFGPSGRLHRTGEAPWQLPCRTCCARGETESYRSNPMSEEAQRLIER